MKKLFCILALFSVLLGAAWAEGLTESDFMGAWVNVYDTKDDGASAEIIYLRDDHKVFYMNRRFNADGPGFGREYVGSWSVNGDCIHIKYGDNTESDVYMSGGFLLIPLSGDNYIPYVKAPVWGEEKKDEAATNGITVPMGEYIIGDEIPEGKYTVFCGMTELAVVWVYAPKASMGKYYSIGTGLSEQKANVTLTDGGRFEVEHGKVYLLPYEGITQ